MRKLVFAPILLTVGLLVGGCGSPKSEVQAASSQSAVATPVARSGPTALEGSGANPSSRGTLSAKPQPKQATTSPPASGSYAGGGGGGGQSRHASSPSREAYLAETKAAREAYKARVAAVAKKEAEALAAATPAGEVLYQGSSKSIPKGILNSPGVRLEVSKNKPGEITVRRLAGFAR